jgi:hypothetical protein
MVDLVSTGDSKRTPRRLSLFPQAFDNALPVAATQGGDPYGLSPERPPERSCVVQKTVDTEALEHLIRLVAVRSWS